MGLEPTTLLSTLYLKDKEVPLELQSISKERHFQVYKITISRKKP